MSIFEIIMLICFGSAWPFSIYKSYTSKSTQGKSLPFLIALQMGYVAGVLHKVLYNFDFVTYLYALNFIMISTDILLFLRNRKLPQNSRVPKID